MLDDLWKHAAKQTGLTPDQVYLLIVCCIVIVGKTDVNARGNIELFHNIFIYKIIIILKMFIKYYYIYYYS